MAAWINRMLARCQQEVLLESTAFKRENAPGGYYLVPKFQTSNHSTAGAQAGLFIIVTLNKSEFYIGAKLTPIIYDPVAGIASAGIDSGNPVKIAKAVPIRRSVTAEFIDGVKIAYRDPPPGSTLNGFLDNNRIANDGTSDESQCVFPRFIAVGDPNGGLIAGNVVHSNAPSIVYAVKVDGGTGVFDASVNPPEHIQWLEVSPARVWAKRYIPT